VHRVFGARCWRRWSGTSANVFWRAFVRGERGLFWGPTSMVPQPRDFVRLLQADEMVLRLGPQPQFEHFDLWEKFDYWAVLWGTALMGAAG
jgi:cytochrome b subunit of formate dehydrogenase